MTERQPTVIGALRALVDAVETVGEHRRYWPRDMYLDGTTEAVERGLDDAIRALQTPAAGEDTQ